jgi:hypothetical protein
MMLPTFFLSILGVISAVAAHPGQSELSKRAEAEARRVYLRSLENTDLAHCAPKLAARGVVERAIARRKETLLKIRKRSFIEQQGTSECRFTNIWSNDSKHN